MSAKKSDAHGIVDFRAYPGNIGKGAELYPEWETHRDPGERPAKCGAVRWQQYPLNHLPP